MGHIKQTITKSNILLFDEMTNIKKFNSNLLKLIQKH